MTFSTNVSCQGLYTVMNMLDNMFGVKELHTMPMNTSTLTKLKISFVYCTVHVPPEVESYRYCRILPYFRST